MAAITHVAMWDEAVEQGTPVLVVLLRRIGELDAIEAMDLPFDSDDAQCEQGIQELCALRGISRTQVIDENDLPDSDL